MGLMRAAAVGAIVGGSMGGFSGAKAADIYRATEAISQESSPTSAFVANNFSEAGGNIIEGIFTVGGVALGAVVAASSSLTFRHDREEANREYSE